MRQTLQGSISIFLFFLFLLFCGMTVLSGNALAQTTLSPGDIAFVGFNGDGDDDFAIVALSDIPANSEIFFTDQDWTSEGEFSGTGDTFSWDSGSSIIPEGTVIIFNDISTGGRTVSAGSYSGGSAITLKVSNTVIFAYTGATNAPSTFLASIATSSDQYDGTEGTLTGTGLSQGSTAILLSEDIDVAEYIGNRGGNTPSGYQSELNDINNWQEENGSGDQSGEILPFNNTIFTILDPPTVAFSVSSDTVSEGDGSVNLTVELREANGTAVDVVVAFLSGSSTASSSDIDNYTTQTVSFGSDDASGSTQTVSVNTTDDSEFEDTETAVFQLQNSTAGSIIEPSVLTLTINDDDTPDVVINEILYDPNGTGGDANGDGTADDGTGDEFVELINNSGRDLDISNWTLSDAAGTKFTFPSGTVIPASNAFVVFATPAEGMDFGGAYLYSAGSLQLNNTGDDVVLKDDNGNEITSVTYDGSESDESITRNPDITGDFEGHTSADSDDDSSPFSPGTKIDGTAFGSSYATGIRGSEGWRMISTPASGTTFEDLFGDFWMQGLSGSNDPNGDGTLYSWSESGGTFVLANNMSDQLDPGKGYIAYFFEDENNNTPGIQGGFPKVVNTDNPENSSPVSVPVTATDSDGSGTIDGDLEGWNLLGNPFGTDISVTALIGALETAHTSVNTNINVWDHTANGGQGDYVTLSDGDRLAPFQAFFVRYTDVVDATASFNRSDLAANTGTEFLRQQNESEFAFNLRLSGEEFFDRYFVEFGSRGDVELDRYDAYKLFSLNPNAINVYGLEGDNKLMKNVLPAGLEERIEIPLGFDAPNRNELTFSWEGMDELPSNWSVVLIDRERNIEINLTREPEYKFSVRPSASEQERPDQRDNRLLNKRSKENEDVRFVMAVTPAVAQNEGGDDTPSAVRINPNYPNPFNPTTTISYELDQEANVELTVWNIVGQKVATLVDEVIEAGEHEEVWDASDMPSGMYIAQLEVNGEVYIRKMTLIK